MKAVYLDYAAGTPVDPAVLEAMTPYFSEKFGNPGSLHSFGQEAIAAVDHSREVVAKEIGAEFREVIFTASATEANNLALRGAIAQFKSNNPHVTPRMIVSKVEHESVLETARALEREGVEVIYLTVNQKGAVNSAQLKTWLNERTALVSIMYANNEVGTIQPVKEIRAMTKAVLHVDAAQAFQFLDCNVQDLGVDFMTLSSHKMYGPKGAGALYIKNTKNIAPIVLGGGQEFDLRSGTENVPAIVGFAKAVELASAAREKESARIGELREQLWDGIKKIFLAAEVNGVPVGEGGGNGGKTGNGSAKTPATLPNILNVYFPGRATEDILTKLDLNGVAASGGSACRSRALESSYVVEALGYSASRAKASVRFSFGRPTTKSDIEKALKVMKLF